MHLSCSTQGSRIDCDRSLKRVFNQEVQNDIIVSKLVQAITYKTRFTAEKVEHICVLYFTVVNISKVPKGKDFATVHTYLSKIYRQRIRFNYPKQLLTFETY